MFVLGIILASLLSAIFKYLSGGLFFKDTHARITRKLDNELKANTASTLDFHYELLSPRFKFLMWRETNATPTLVFSILWALGTYSFLLNQGSLSVWFQLGAVLGVVIGPLGVGLIGEDPRYLESLDNWKEQLIRQTGIKLVQKRKDQAKGLLERGLRYLPDTWVSSLLPGINLLPIEEALPLYKAGLVHNDPEMRIKSASVMVVRARDVIIEDYLKSMLASDLFEFRKISYQLLQELPYEERRNHYMALLSNKREEIRTEALKIVRKIMPFEVHDLVELSTYNWPQLRFMAFSALFNVPGEEATKALWKGILDSDPDVQLAAIAGLVGRGFDRRYFNLFVGASKATDVRFQRIAIKAMGKFRRSAELKSEAQLILIPFFSTDGKLALLASDTLALFGNDFLEKIEQKSVFSGEEGFWTCRTLAKIKTRESLTILARYTANDDERVTRMALQAEAILNKENEYAFANRWLTHDDTVVVRRGIEKAKKLKDIRLAEPLDNLILMHRRSWEGTIGFLMNVEEESPETENNALAYDALFLTLSNRRTELYNAYPAVYCAACNARGIVKHTKIMPDMPYVVCRVCGDNEDLEINVQQVIGLIGGTLPTNPLPGTRYYEAWDEESKTIFMADYDRIEVLGGDSINYDWALSALLQNYQNQDAEAPKPPSVVLYYNPNINVNTYRLLEEAGWRVQPAETSLPNTLTTEHN